MALMNSARFGDSEGVDLTPWIDHVRDMVAADGDAIDSEELADLLAYAQTIPGYPTGGETAAAALAVNVVPEPGSAALLLLSSSSLLARRRRLG